MKQIMVFVVAAVIGSSLAILPVAAQSQLVQWQSLDGPWYAPWANDISIGYRGGQRVIYVNIGGTRFFAAAAQPCTQQRGISVSDPPISLVKSINEGERWIHLPIENPLAVACVPHKPERLYVGVAYDGIWKSTDGGSSFFRTGPGFANYFPRTIAISPHDENVVYVGCVNHDDRPTVYRTTDGGISWHSVRPFNTNQLNVTSIVFDPRDSLRIWIAGYDNDPNTTGVWFTQNGGASWAQRNSGMTNAQIGALVGDPASLDTLYAGTGMGLDSRIYKTTNGGEQWFATYQSTVNFAISEMEVDAILHYVYAVTTSGMLRSDDGGTTWVWRTAGMYDRIGLSVAVDAAKPGVVYTGTWASLYWSSNGGDSWQERTKGICLVGTRDVGTMETGIFTVADQIGRDLPALLPPQPAVDRTLDGGSTWNLALHFGDYPEFCAFLGRAVATSPSKGSVILAGGVLQLSLGLPCILATSHTVIVRSSDLGETFTITLLRPSGKRDPYFVHEIEFDPNDQSVAFAVTDANSPPGDPWATILKTTDAGTTWSGVRTSEDGFFGIEIDPSSRNPLQTLYACGIGIIKSTDGGTSWTPTGLQNIYVYSLALDPSNPTIIYAGTETGINKTSDGGDRWELLPNSPQYVFSLRVHSLTSRVIYAVQKYPDRVLRSTDAGASWSDMGGGLPNASIHRLSLDGQHPSTIYTATDSGVYSIPHIWTGELAANTTWRSGETYLVEGQLTVPTGITLTVEEGAVVQFDTSAGLFVYGSLQAVSTQAKPIRFEKMPQAPQGRWYGIMLYQPTQSTLSYCAISDAQYGVVASTFRIVQYPTITNCTITKCAVGIYLWGPLSHEQGFGIDSNRIQDCDFGIVTNSGDDIDHAAQVLLEDNVVLSSLKAGAWFAHSSPVLLGNRFENGRQEVIICTDGGNAQFGRRSEPGRNIVANNASVQLFAQYASPFLGLVDDEISCNLIAGGLNRVFHNSDAVPRVHASGSGTVVQADKTFWGYPVLEQWFIASHDAKIIRRCPLGDEETEETRMLLAAAALRADGLYEQALALYDSVISGRPYAPEAAAALAACAETYKDYFASSGDTTLAAEKIAYLTEVAIEHPVVEIKELAKLYLARAYEDKDNPAEALALYDELLQEISEPELKAIVYRSLVALYATQGDLDQARATWAEMSTHVAGNRHVELTRIDLALFTGEIIPVTGMGKGAASGAAAPGGVPSRYSLEQNFPNPFNPTTEIWFKLGADGYITLKLYDVLGREIKTLAEGNYEAGYYSVTLNASELSSGVYFYRMTTRDYTAVRKLLVMK